MASFNQLILLGNCTRDPEMRYLPNNTPVVEFGMACNRKFKDSGGQDREEVMFIDCAAFGKQAEVLNQYAHKGDLLFIEGRLKLDTWEDKQGGGKRSKHRVAINTFQLMPNRQQDQQPDRQQPAMRSQPASRQRAQVPADQPFDDQQQFKEDDIPF
jgi:single-strand DNA-binding protein